MKQTSRGVVPLAVVILALVLSVTVALFVRKNDKEIDLNDICNENNCPEEYCTFNCVGGGNLFGCVVGCVPKHCIEFPAEKCPLGSCQIMINNKNEQICYYKPKGDLPECGDVGYYGHEVGCCEGLEKRSGKLLPDGSCEMTRGGYQDLFPYCLACGDGKCDSLENKCNCPEDCS